MQRAYGYVYDPLNRLLQGDFVARTASLPATPSASGLWKSEEDNYRLSFASYDDNGNIQTLRRRGLLANATHASPKRFEPVDALTYAYAGNRLQVVDDAVTGNQLPRPRGYEGAPTSLAGDFQEGGTHLAQEYLYDANGNLTQDRNKGITGIAYNHLNLPRLIRFGLGADSIVFRYTAAGQKVAKLVYQTGKPVGRTDYLGPYQYEQDSLRFFPHAEGRVLRVVSYDAARQPTVRYQREFTFKDHLGNLRLAYRAGQVRTLTATLNLDDAAAHRRETQQFDSVSVSAPVAFRVGPALARSDGYVARLNAGGSAPQPLGPLTQFAVQKGDTLRVTAPGLYPQPASNNTFAFSLAGFVASLLSPAPGAPAGADGTRRGGLPLLQVGLNSAALLALRQLPGGVPKGYLRVLSFNEDSVLVDQRTVQLTAAALNNYETLATGPLVVQQTGYVSVYVGNESAVDVYFDDLTVEHRQGLQVQENQYDPFGLSLTGLDYNTSALKNLNMKQFNGQEKIIDLGLCLYTYRYREYDFQLGRFSRVDPLAEKFPYLTTYQFASNSPIWLRELEGLEGVRYTDVDGTEGVRKNVVVLLEPLKQAGVGSSQKEIDHVNNQNALIERRNASTLSIIRAETSQYLDNNGKGSKDSNGNTIRVTTNVIGIPDFDKKGMTRSQVDNKYTQISREYGEKGTKFDKFGASLDINAGAAVITREGSGGAQGSTVNNIIRLNFNGPEGTRSHEIGHSLGLNDNGYKIGGILNNPPMQLISPEVDVITRESYQSIAPAPSPPVLP